MIPYVVRYIEPEDLDLFTQIKQAVDQLNKSDLGVDDQDDQIVLSCHILARAVAKVFDLKHVDGLYHPNFDHTWLITNGGQLIDVYPVSTIGGQIMIVTPKMQTPAYWLYKPKRLNAGFAKPWFRRAVRITIAALQKNLSQS